jgi:hypothetical protein
MRFGRVEGVVTPEADGRLRLVVCLETVRDEVLAPLRPLSTFADLVWHADQWTQETIGITLAEQGWEAIGAGDLPDDEAGEQLARSAPYAVRNLTWS